MTFLFGKPSGGAGEPLGPRASTALTLHAFHTAAEALCGVFVSVYLWINSLDFQVVCRHYLALYIVTPIVFILAGWYSSKHDRLHVYRGGLVLYAGYYATLLILRERSPAYAPHLGALLGCTWGLYWAGANTFNFDVTQAGNREYYLGLLMSVNGVVRLLAPLVSGLVIFLEPVPQSGYRIVFAIALMLYVGCFVLSFRMPSDAGPRPFRLRRALFPGKDQHDWRVIMAAAVSLCGSFSIFTFFLGLLMYMETADELSVGGYASFQALVGVLTAYLVGRAVVPRTRKAFLRIGVTLLVTAGALISLKLSFATLLLFGFLRSVSGPFFGIPHGGLKLDTIARYAETPAQRIEYLTAWEVPLALGRIAMMTAMMLLYRWLEGNDVGLRAMLFLLCAVRIVTYFTLTQADALKREH